MPTKRPPFTGIHETPAAGQDPGTHEGGGELPPYGEDWFQRIVDVNWAGAGGVFVSGDSCCFERYVKLEKPTLDQEWIGLGALEFGSARTEASSYAKIDGKPVILLGGTRDGFPDPTDYGGLIMMSRDGLSWRRVFFDKDNPTVSELFWNTKEKRFLANVSARCFVSPDGQKWTEIEDDFWDHVTTPHGEADGKVGYDAKNDLYILPWELDLDFMGVIECTAFVNGIWMAGGETSNGDSGTACSIDGGKTWELVTSGALEMEFDGLVGNFGILTMIAVPLGDLE